MCHIFGCWVKGLGFLVYCLGNLLFGFWNLLLLLIFAIVIAIAITIVIDF
jgi:hypothetical protein